MPSSECLGLVALRARSEAGTGSAGRASPICSMPSCGLRAGGLRFVGGFDMEQSG